MSANTAWNFGPLLERFHQRKHEAQSVSPPPREQDDQTTAAGSAVKPSGTAGEITASEITADEIKAGEIGDDPGPCEKTQPMGENTAARSKPSSPYQKPSQLSRSLEQCRTLALEFEGASLKSRAMLYKALERAYAFSFECDAEQQAYKSLCDAHGLKIQQRAPFTPIVKLVFGCNYDKTRLSEYARCLSFAKRNKQSPDDFRAFIEGQKGGVKGCAQAERLAVAKGGAAPAKKAQEAALSALRAAPVIGAFKAAPSTTGKTAKNPDSKGEFVLLLARQSPSPDGQMEVISVLGEQDLPLTPIMKKAAKKFAPAKKAPAQEKKPHQAKEKRTKSHRKPDIASKAPVALTSSTDTATQSDQRAPFFSPSEEKLYKVAQSLAGPFDDARLAARYRLLYPKGELPVLTPLAYCHDAEGPSHKPRFMRRLDNNQFEFVGLKSVPEAISHRRGKKAG